MSLIYILIAKKKNVLAEYTEHSGNFASISRLLLEIIPPNTTRKSYIYDDYVFNQVVKKGITFMVMSDKEIGFLIPYAFLEEICKKYFEMFTNSTDFITLSLDEEFKPVLKEYMKKFNEYESNDFKNIKSQINDMQNIMIENIEKILERKEKIDILVNKSEKLNEENINFRRQAMDFNFYTWLENYKLCFYATLTGLFIFFFIWSIYYL